MKIYKILLSVVIVCVMLSSFVISTYANSTVSVYLNNEQVEFETEPVFVNGRTMVPMRELFEKLGAEVYWNNDTKTATAFKDTTYVSVTIGSKFMDTFSKSIELDSPAIIIDGKTFVPLRAVSEAFSCDVLWDGNTNTVNVYSDDYIDYTQEEETQTVVNVATSFELLNAIGNNKRIVLTSNYYNLSDLAPIDNVHVEKQLNYDEAHLDGYIIKNVVNMTIEGEAEIAINEKMADVLQFKNCRKITLSGLTIGHTASYDEYRCEGAVTRFDTCDNININNCNLYGCGAVGIYADNVNNLNVYGGKIYDCTYTGIWLTNNSSAKVDSVEFLDSIHLSGFLKIVDSSIECINCNIHDIVCKDFAEGFIEIANWSGEEQSISFTNCSFSDNTFNNIASRGTQNVTFNKCTFSNNNGDMQNPNVIYNN